ncbi:MAG: peptidoglycan-binding protein [Fibrobacteres bacterium]|nr:peptidoglycan-binding protein [Fibrobacterota bacterium]
MGHFKADGNGKWGTREAQLILEHLGIYKGEAAGILDSATAQAITQFQKSVNEKGKTQLEQSGKLDASTCQALLWAYCQMAVLPSPNVQPQRWQGVMEIQILSPCLTVRRPLMNDWKSCSFSDDWIRSHRVNSLPQTTRLMSPGCHA